MTRDSQVRRVCTLGDDKKEYRNLSDISSSGLYDYNLHIYPANLSIYDDYNLQTYVPYKFITIGTSISEACPIFHFRFDDNFMTCRCL